MSIVSRVPRPITLLALAAALLASACGTGAVNHRIEIAIEDPSGRLGNPPYQLSLFDPQMGHSEEWARRGMATAAPGRPFATTYGTVETKMLFDRTPPRRIAAGVWLPAYEKAGFFQIVLEPRAGAETTVPLPFAPWADVYPEGARVVPLTARVTADDNRQGGWNLRMTIAIPGL